MVRITSNGYAIEINSALHPANDYVETTNGLVELLKAQESADSCNSSVLRLLQNMLPTFEQAKCMFNNESN